MTSLNHILFQLGIDKLLAVRLIINPMRIYREILRYFLLRLRYDQHVHFSELKTGILQ